MSRYSRTGVPGGGPGGGPRIVDTILRNLLAYGVTVAALLAMAGCDAAALR
ncbi:hypothetical protein [Streptomyces sp. G-G2]|uniref:hypothetical protein n=1 Tax=Streptomyces sp. G-G2 TaxID=3046201 RepID=UPI0024B8B103|nr:hypothetical protein [Streptomyces sp. G-G2]MDJ0385539.1 hypothetical protein [Streptomyces sp. G-G2]